VVVRCESTSRSSGGPGDKARGPGTTNKECGPGDSKGCCPEDKGGGPGEDNKGYVAQGQQKRGQQIQIENKTSETNREGGRNRRRIARRFTRIVARAELGEWKQACAGGALRRWYSKNPVTGWEYFQQRRASTLLRLFIIVFRRSPRG
jgi:hypothetical protein